jgi:uncharacterized RDD family membrane protein YckC
LNAPAELAAPSLARRMACWLYEGMLLFGVVFTAGLVFSIAGQMRSGIDERQWLFKAFLFVICGVYCTWSWSRGQTLAMRTWRIRVLDRLGRPVTQGRAFLRYLACWVWFLPPLAALESKQFSVWQAAVLFVGWVAVWALASRFHPQRQFWHDAMAGTRLVEA